MFALAFKSFRNRKFTTILTIVSIALSVTLLLGVERIRKEARASFTNTISGTDLIVGARSGPVQLLLYAVFRIGNATNNISWQSYREIARIPQVQWTIPISLGDSHKGYRVVGTNTDYFEYLRYAGRRRLEMAAGRIFEDVFDAVLGAEVARKLNYHIGDPIIIAHGAGEVSFIKHGDKPFKVVGILQKTGTPIDQSIHVRLEGIEAIHIDWQEGAPVAGQSISPDTVRQLNLTPKTLSAFFVGLKSRIAVFGVQRFVNEYPKEPLLAILPGVALQELWDLIGVAEKALLAVSGFVVIVGLSGMLIALMTSLNERRREMAILRSVGARPFHVFSLIVGESTMLTLAGVVSGVALLYGILLVGQPLISNKFGLFIAISGLSVHDLFLMGTVCLAGLIIGIIPGYRIYRFSLADGMTIRI
ncbi:ABC-type antimicrobial peptide transport system, permease component [Olavius algarvensis Delta 1 endosymbiont]|nr:ABC-type antimicrobial peptide transport system, permease component [Olavius algarvensis Delta 1 endosymbiont]